MEQMWRNPERHVEDIDFFTELYESTEWLLHRQARHLYKNGEFMERREDLDLNDHDLQKVGEFMSANRLPGDTPESVQFIIQGRNPRIYRDSPGGSVEVIMRTRNEFTIYAFVHGYEDHQPRPEDERALTVLKAFLKVTNWNLAGQSGLLDPRSWHDERFKVHKMYKDEGLKILDLIKFLA